MSKKSAKVYSAAELTNIAIVVLCALLPVLDTMETIKSASGVVLFPDEVGYWADAMTLAGKDWSGVSSLFPWYSYGYSLLLVPLIKVLHNPTTLYRAALILNIGMIELTYALWINIIKKVASKTTLGMRALISGIVICYPTYVLYSNIALPEIASLLSFTLICYVMTLICDKCTPIRAGVLGLLSVLIFTVHNRNIGVLIAIVVAMVIVIIKSENKLSNALAFVLCIAIPFVVYSLVKNNLKANLWPNGVPSANDATDQGSKFKTVFGSIDGLWLYIRMFFSQLGAVALSTCGIAMVGLVGLVMDVIKAICQRSGKYEFKLLIVLAFVFSLGISALFLIDFTRADQIVYTRYVDTVVSSLLVMGAIYISKLKETKGLLVVIASAVLPMLIGVASAASILTDNPSVTYLNVVNCPALTRQSFINGLDFYGYAFIPVVIAALIIVCAYLLKNKTNVVIAIMAVVMMSYMGYSAKPCVDWAKDSQQYYCSENQYLSSIDSDVVYYEKDNNIEFIMYAQYRLADKTFVRIDEEVPEGAFVLNKVENR